MSSSPRRPSRPARYRARPTSCLPAAKYPSGIQQWKSCCATLIARHDVDCWLVNTGWTGGAYGVGSRMPIAATRALLSAALDGSLREVEFRTDPHFGFAVPVSVPDVDSAILDPRATWADTAAYDRQAAKLVGMFVDNFAKFEEHVDGAVLNAAPRMNQAAE